MSRDAKKTFYDLTKEGYHERAQGRAPKVKLKWLDADDRKTGNCYAGINFRGVRMLTFSVSKMRQSYFDRTGNPGWLLCVGKEEISAYPNKAMAQAAAQKFLDDFIRGLFAHGD